MLAECTMSTIGFKRGKLIFQTCTKICPVAKTHLPLVLDLFTIQNAQQCDNTLPADIVFRYVLRNISSFRV